MILNFIADEETGATIPPPDPGVETDDPMLQLSLMEQYEWLNQLVEALRRKKIVGDDIEDEEIDLHKLAIGIDATGIDFDADKVDGYHARDFVHSPVPRRTIKIGTASGISLLAAEVTSSPILFGSAFSSSCDWVGGAPNHSAGSVVLRSIKSLTTTGFTVILANMDLNNPVTTDFPYIAVGRDAPAP